MRLAFFVQKHLIRFLDLTTLHKRSFRVDQNYLNDIYPRSIVTPNQQIQEQKPSFKRRQNDQG